MARAYTSRLADPLIVRLLGELPAVYLVGPRAVGKTTTALRHARTLIRLDREAEAVAWRADPDAMLAGLEEPVLLDEWQVVPGVLGAVKRAVDADPRPGRFVVSGSVRAELDAPGWPGTGRLVRVTLHGMTVREQLGRASGPGFVSRLAQGESPGLPPAPPDLRGYVDLALRGGFPEPALHLSPGAARRWLEGYADAVVTRDAGLLGERRDPRRLARYLQALALNTAGVVEHRTLYESAGIDRRTAVAYDQLLDNLMVCEAVPAWSSNRLKRLARAPKRYLLDSGLAAAILGLDASAVLAEGDLLGRLLDTFVAAQLRAECALSGTARLHHLRQEQGRHEVDLVLELDARRLVGIEIKASTAPEARDARHLAWLRDELGRRFVAGLVLHTGHRLYPLGERLLAAPISSLWG